MKNGIVIKAYTKSGKLINISTENGLVVVMYVFSGIRKVWKNTNNTIYDFNNYSDYTEIKSELIRAGYTIIN